LSADLQSVSMERDLRLDWLKGLAMALVLLWHLHPVSYSVTGYNHVSTVFRILVDGFYWDITLLGVPIFFAVALRLYYARREREAAYFRRRVLWLVGCFVFWTVVQWAVASAVNRGLPGLSWDNIRQGGPELPLVGGSVFYFLFDLIMLVLLAECVLRLPDRTRYVLLVIMGVVVPLFVFTGLEAAGIALHYSLLTCFIPYVSAAYVWTRWPGRFHNLRWWFTGLWLAGVCLEQVLYRLTHAVPAGGPPYARAAIFFGALSVCAWATSPGSRLGGRVTYYLSRYSLGIFALHKYFQLLMLKVVPEWGVAFAGVELDLRYLAIFVPTLALTFVGVALLAHSPLRRFVS
jgi:hypothetical protein